MNAKINQNKKYRNSKSEKIFVPYSKNIDFKNQKKVFKKLIKSSNTEYNNQNSDINIPERVRKTYDLNLDNTSFKKIQNAKKEKINSNYDNKSIFKNLNLQEYKRAWDFFKDLKQEIKNNQNLFSQTEIKETSIDKNKNYHLEEYEHYTLFEKIILPWERKIIVKNGQDHFDYLEILFNKKTYKTIICVLKKEKKYFSICVEAEKQISIIDQNVEKIHGVYKNKESYRNKIKWTKFLIQTCEIEISIIKLRNKKWNFKMEKWLKDTEKNLDNLKSNMNYYLSVKNLEIKENLIIKYQELISSNEKLVQKTEKLAESSEKSTEATQKIAEDNQKQTKFYKWIAIISIIAILISAAATIADIIIKT